MPTISEFNELCNKCDWTWTSQGGHQGYLVTSKTNGKSIFLPAAGWRTYTDWNDEGEDGCYWSSTLSSSNSSLALELTFWSSGVRGEWISSRKCGRSVRPVTD